MANFLKSFFKQTGDIAVQSAKYAFIAAFRAQLQGLATAKLPPDAVREIAMVRDTCNAILLAQSSQ